MVGSSTSRVVRPASSARPAIASDMDRRKLGWVPARRSMRASPGRTGEVGVVR
jgi:hypothetical protein